MTVEETAAALASALDACAAQLIGALRECASVLERCRALAKAPAAGPVFTASGEAVRLSTFPEKYSQERIAVMQTNWPAGMPREKVLDLVNDLPGPRFTLPQLKYAVSELKLKRPAGFISACRKAEMARKVAAVMAPSAVPVAGKDLRLPVRTAERDALIRREWSNGMPNGDILAMVNQLPGKQITGARLAILAAELGVKRPAGFRFTRKVAAPETKNTQERIDRLKKLWLRALDDEQVLGLVNILPGEPLSMAELRGLAAELNLKRPPPVAQKPAELKPPPKIAPYVKPQAAPPAKAVPTPNQRKRAAEAELVAAHIAAKGVTRCPPAVAAETTHKPSPEDAAAMRKIIEAGEQARHQEVRDRVDRNLRARAARLTGKPQKGHASA